MSRLRRSPRLRPQLVRRRIRSIVVGSLFAGICLTSQVLAQPASERGRGVPAEAPRSEAQWLQWMQSAARRLSFSGTVVYKQGEQMRASRVVQVVDGEGARERVQWLDGPPREYLRQGDEVICLMPNERRMTVERRSPGDAFPALSDSAPGEILASYSVKVGSVDRVAGHDCQWLALEARDRLRYSYRLCVERLRGLLLKAMTLDARQDVLEQIAFSEVRIGEGIDRSQVRASWPTDGWKVDRPELPAADLAKQGWTLQPPPGFRKVREVGRRMTDAGGRESVALQALYSDGVATFSVFVSPLAGPGPALAAAPSQGPTNAFVRRVAEAQITVVGEVPAATTESVARSVEYRGSRR